MSPPELWVGLRWARACLVASLAWGTASLGHVLGGGELPSAWFIAVLVAVTSWPFSMALRTRASGLRMIVLLGVGQAAMHTALVVASWSGGPAPAVDPHGAMTGIPSAPAMMPDGHAMSLLPGPFMLLAHIVAALVLGLVLADAERSVFALLGLLLVPVQDFGREMVRRVLTLLAFGTLSMRDAGPDARGGVDVPIGRLLQRLLGAAIGRRGPPRVLA